MSSRSFFAATCLLAFAGLWGSTVAQSRLCEEYTPTVDGGRCRPEDTSCEFKLVVTRKFAMTKADGTKLFVKDYQVFSADGQPALTEEELKDVVVGDGATQRYVLVANGTMPGPCLTVFTGQSITLHVLNQLSNESLTLHMHGLHYRDNCYNDGVSMVSQCPILPGKNFTYRFSPNQYPGTYWYHSHHGPQRSKGIFGPLIVLDKQSDTLPHNERVLVLQDWYHDTSFDSRERMLRQGHKGSRGKRGARGPTYSVEGAQFTHFDFHSGLINGRGRYYTDTSSSPPVVQNKTPLDVIEVEKDQEYRFRVINSGAIYPFRISVQGHRIGVTASDGFDFEVVPSESLIIHPGERYDFFLTANQTVGNYMIFAETLQTGQQVRHVAEAVLHYRNASAWDGVSYLPTSQQRGCSHDNPCVVVNCPFMYYPQGDNTRCVHLSDLKPVGTPDTAISTAQRSSIKEMFLNFGFPGLPGPHRPAINGIAFMKPPVAAILNPKNMSTVCNSSCGKENVKCTCTHVVTLTRNAVHQIVLMGLGSGNGFSHPVHIHGYSFYVVKMGFPPYNNETGHLKGNTEDIECVDDYCNVAHWKDSSWVAKTGGEVSGLNLVNPIRKDTIIVPTGGYVVLRLKADNPGMWFLHCHIEMHHEQGMALILDGSDGLSAPPAGYPTCDYSENGPKSGQTPTTPTGTEGPKSGQTPTTPTGTEDGKADGAATNQMATRLLALCVFITVYTGLIHD